MQTKEENKRYLLLFLTTLLVTLVYFSPFVLSALRGYKPELRFLGDLQLAGFPSFIQAGKYFSDWTYRGLDFFTANGASSLFTRPNFSTYYLPQLLLQSVFQPTDNTDAAKLFTVQMWLGGFLAMLFTTLWLNKIVRINIYLSLLGGSLFFSIVGYIYSQISFLNVAYTFPILMYCLSVSISRKTDILQKILLSIPLVMILTAGYLPIAVMGVCIAVIATLAIAKYVTDGQPQYRDFFIVLGIGALAISGYFLTIVEAVKIVPSIPKIPLIESVFFSDLALTYKGALSVFLASAPNDSGEASHFRLGMPILVLMYVACLNITANGDVWKRNTFIMCIVFFLLSILLAMGRYSGFADIFFYSVPGLGGMHIYARYMLISVFFLVFALILGLSDLYTSVKTINLKVPIIAISITFLLILLSPSIFTENKISLPVLFVELLVSILLLFTLSLRGDNRFFLLVIPLLVFHQGSLVYMNTNWISFANTGNTVKDIVNSDVRTRNLIGFFYANTDKLLIKYIDITPEIEKQGGVPHNFPWFIRYQKNDPRRISSYMGYDQGLAQQLEYAQKFSYFGTFNKNYLAESGVDYVIYDQKSKVKENEWLISITDKNVPEYDIGNGFFAVKVLPINSPSAAPVFNNGIFKVNADNSSFDVKSFRTDWSLSIGIDFKSAQSGTLSFQLFPHKDWEYRLDGDVITPVISPAGVASFSFPAGAHKFVVDYSNYSILFFLWTYFSYLFVIFLILIKYFLKYCSQKKMASAFD